MYPWYYVWSPRYRIFHEVMQFAVKDISGVSVRPICLPQNIFTPRVEHKHFFTGIGIKIYCMLKSLKAHPNEHIIFSDVDLILPDKKLAEKLKEYEKNDITAMLDKDGSEDYNIGFMLIKSTPEVIQFFEKVLQRIHKEVLLDQDVFNEEIQQFTGTHGKFSRKDFIQSNMIRKDIWDAGNYSVIQCLYAAEDPAEVMCGKLASVIYFYNITNLLQFIDREVAEKLQEYLQYQNPNHYLVSVDLNAIYGNLNTMYGSKEEKPEEKVESSTEQLPKDA